MLPRRKRFPRSLFAQALSRGKRLSSKHFSVVLPEGVGYAVVVPKRVASRAVQRNRIRRRTLAILKSLADHLPPALIVFPKASVHEVHYQELEEEFKNLLSTIRA